MTVGSVLLRGLAGVLLMLGVLAPVTAADPVGVPYQWSQSFITAPDGTRLHADILRPEGIAADTRTPVVMTVSPYRSHTAYLSVPRLEGGPSTDDLHVAMFLNAGYTYVIVDLRGYGGSSGCPDFGGPGERSDVATAVAWAAGQPWSTGRVGMIGTSYEAWTGMMALAAAPAGLAAVAAFGPDVDPYAYMYMQGVAWKFSGKPVTESGIRPAEMTGFEHLLIASTPGRPDDSPEYQSNAVQISAGCYEQYAANTTNHDASTPFWRERDLVAELRGNTIPLFVGQGFLDYNTRAYRIFDVWNALGPGDHRAWFGQWGHSDCDSKCGAPDFATQLLAFFDKHVADRDIEVPGPRVTVGQFDGGWRSETAWPPADSRRIPIDLRTGTYTDRGLLPGPDREIWSISEPLSTTQHISGIPTATLRLSGPPTATVAVELFDIAPDGRGTIITRGIAPVADTADIRLLAQDWPIIAGHRLGVRITDVVDDVWSHAAANAQVTVLAARLDLPLLSIPRTPDLTGGTSEAWAKWRVQKVRTLGPEVLNNAVMPMNLSNETGPR
ncbi:CocE/NonD family hydrolase [Nocardia sp. CA-135398]|uniref:CocE/NonD family hydrolase n=1 Tax=Nocardia sp. CA-135398 TaxID=3239977 RepID=UPI003D999C8E